MNTNLLKKVEASLLRNDLPQFNVGDEISVHNVIREGDKKRTQIFKGIVLARKGVGLSATFTVRKISDGIGVEKIFPLHSPNIKKIEVSKRGKVRRSKIYYMRDRSGRLAMKINSATDTQLKRMEKTESDRLAAIEAEEEKAKKAAEKAKEEETKAETPAETAVEEVKAETPAVEETKTEAAK